MADRSASRVRPSAPAAIFAALAYAAGADTAVRPGASVRLDAEPRRVHHVEPIYPEAERAAGIEADVSVPVHVNAAGEVYWAGSQPGSALHEAAAAAVRQWRYEPSNAVARSFSARVRFRLRDKAIHAMPLGAVFDQWLGDDLAARAEALRELGDRGTSIVPFLDKALRGPELLRRCGAAHLAAGLGRDARRMAAALVGLVRETAALEKPPGWCSGAGEALALVDPDAFTAELDRAVRSGDAGLCRRLVTGSYHFREPPTALLAALLLDGCSDEAARFLRSDVPVKDLPQLMRVARNAPARARQTAIGAIARTLAGMEGSERQARIDEAMPVLLAALGDPETWVRSVAVDALGGLGADAAPAVAALARALEDPSRSVRWQVLLAFAKLGSTARAAGPALLRQVGAPLPPQEAVRTGLTDEAMQEQLQAAIAATGAGKDGAKLAAEDEIRAAVVAHVLGRRGAATGRDPRPFSVSVLRERSPAGLLAALARRGLVPVDSGTPVDLAEVVWGAGDLVSVKVSIGRGMESSGATYTVGLQNGAWAVVGEHHRWIS